MTLAVLPARTLPTVSTAGSNADRRRVVILCGAMTIAHATGTGSTGVRGMEECPLSGGHDVQSVDGSQGGARSRGDHSGGQQGHHMQRESPVHGPGTLQQAFLTHDLGVTGSFLAWLEHEDHASVERVAGSGEQPGRTDQLGRVGVVPTGMHDSFDRGRVGQPRPLGQRQSMSARSSVVGTGRNSRGGHRCEVRGICIA
jgi:hypothetical protein